MRNGRPVVAWYVVLSVVASQAAAVAALKAAEKAEKIDPQMTLWRELDLGSCRGTFPCLGDLTGDGKVDFLLYRQGPHTTPGYLAALDHEGRKLWEMGDASLIKHAPDGRYREPALRGIALVFDVDQDGRSEVVTEFWGEAGPMLYVLDGATGKIEHARAAPFDMNVRGGGRSRCHPVGRIAYLKGKDQAPAIVLKFGASGYVPCHAVALDSTLHTLWHVTADGNAMGHVPSVGDVDGDGRDEIILGTLLVDDDGKPAWQKPAPNHADCTAILDRPSRPDQAVLISICNSGPAFCISAQGETLWETTTREVSHGQGVWVGNFVDEEPGQEVVILRSGHVGDFLTVRGDDGTRLAAFKQRREYQGYPDFPCVVHWKSRAVASLWIPIDRALVDGKGRVVAELGPYEERVRNRLHWGTSKANLAAQAFAVDLCGDERDELVLYQPYNGEGILIFTQADSDGREKPYVHQKSVYNMRTYF